MNYKVKKYLFLSMVVFFLASCSTNKPQINDSEESTLIIDYGEYIKDKKTVQKFKKDLVPDANTAIKIADAIWDVEYYKIKGVRDLPYTVTLEDDKVWYVKTNLPKGSFGLVLYIKINKYDGKILNLWSSR